MFGFISNWFGKEEVTKTPKYDPGFDKPTQKPVETSVEEQHDSNQQQGTYSPYSLPPDSGIDSAQHVEMRRKIGQASLENCSVLEGMLAHCIKNGSFKDKRVRGCDWLREHFYSCLKEQRHALTELGYALPGNSPKRDFKIRSLADRLAQEREKEADEGN
ncbi:hypothetical protein E3P99_03776 [Wallemia hederae]|uniref:Uncharacterized protein n=1 Tax=Wallemia hederae TaxID=1540922 RepID=A0A4T0FFY8_9BASI|nr:hypothetical protein E3P99_03776 [Wallemia hederae]